MGKWDDYPDPVSQPSPLCRLCGQHKAVIVRERDGVNLLLCPSCDGKPFEAMSLPTEHRIPRRKKGA